MEYNNNNDIADGSILNSQLLSQVIDEWNRDTNKTKIDYIQTKRCIDSLADDYFTKNNRKRFMDLLKQQCAIPKAASTKIWKKLYNQYQEKQPSLLSPENSDMDEELDALNHDLWRYNIPLYSPLSLSITPEPTEPEVMMSLFTNIHELGYKPVDYISAKTERAISLDVKRDKNEDKISYYSMAYLNNHNVSKSAEPDEVTIDNIGCSSISSLSASPCYSFVTNDTELLHDKCIKDVKI